MNKQGRVIEVLKEELRIVRLHRDALQIQVEQDFVKISRLEAHLKESAKDTEQQPTTKENTNG